MARYGAFVNLQSGSAPLDSAGDLFNIMSRTNPLPFTPRFTIDEIVSPVATYGPEFVELGDVMRHPVRFSDPETFNVMTTHLRSENFSNLSGAMRERVLANTYNSMSRLNKSLPNLPSFASRALTIGRSAMGSIYTAGARIVASINPTVAAVVLGVLAVAAIGYGIYRLISGSSSQSSVPPVDKVEDAIASTLPGPGFLNYFSKSGPDVMVHTFFKNFPFHL